MPAWLVAMLPCPCSNARVATTRMLNPRGHSADPSAVPTFPSAGASTINRENCCLKTAHRSFHWAMVSTEHGIEQALAVPSSQQGRGMGAPLTDGWGRDGCLLGGRWWRARVWPSVCELRASSGGPCWTARRTPLRQWPSPSAKCPEFAHIAHPAWLVGAMDEGGLLCVGLFLGDADAKMQRCKLSAEWPLAQCCCSTCPVP